MYFVYTDQNEYTDLEFSNLHHEISKRDAVFAGMSYCFQYTLLFHTETALLFSRFTELTQNPVVHRHDSTVCR